MNGTSSAKKVVEFTRRIYPGKQHNGRWIVATPDVQYYRSKEEVGLFTMKAVCLSNIGMFHPHQFSVHN
jgi:hypothetical protein